MRTITVTEKYRAVQEGTMSKNEFVRQMRQEYPMYVSNFDGFDSTVSILKTRNMLFEAPKKAFENVKVYDDRPALTYSLDALHRGIRAELGKNNNPTSEEFIAAEKKAKDNLEKDSNHYLNLMAGESNKVDKHDREKEVKRGALDKDTFNDMKKATLKENMYIDDEEWEKEMDRTPEDTEKAIDKEASKMSEDAKKNLLGKVVGALRANYPDITAGILKDFIKTHYQDLLDGADIEDEFAEYISVNYEGPSDMGEAEKAAKDYDKDGEVESPEDEYKGSKDRAIKAAMGKQNQLKEAIKTIIKKTLTEEVVNEAATKRLADWGEGYESFEGVKSVVNDLENVVTEVEAFYDKIGDKIAKIFERTSGFKNDEGLSIGAFIAPSLETAFFQDLKPVTKKGFLYKIDLPKVKTISQADVQSARERGEIDETPEEPKTTVFTPNF